MLEEFWYKNAILYAIDVKSFHDSNHDGIGDLQGVIEKLSYLSELGVNCLWLLPFYPSPLKDNGYDVTNYYEVDSRLGDLQIFRNLIIKASERGIKVIIDIVMNHTSDEHPWFKASKLNSQSLFRNYYIWRTSPPLNSSHDHPAFPDSEPNVWRYDETANSYYYHKFYHFQPDLNLSNILVREEIHKVLDFWFSFGIAGVRLDAAPVMLQSKGGIDRDAMRPHELFQDMRSVIDSKKNNSILVGEVDVDGDQLIDYFDDGEGLHLVFNFIFNAYLVAAISEKKSEILIQGHRELPVIPESCSWLNFLRNLDEFNLFQLPEDLKNRVLEKIAPDPRMRIYNRGVRRRLAAIFNGDKDQLKMCMALLFSLPGTPMIVYGDEIGLGDNLDLWERESVRTPMQWDSTPHGGFSSIIDESQIFRKLANEENFIFKKVNVHLQKNDHESLLNGVKKIISTRKNHPEIGFGKIEWVSVNHPSIIAHVCHWRNHLLLALHNLSDERIEARMNFKTFYAKEFLSLLGDIKLIKEKNGEYSFVLNRYEYGWFRVLLSPKDSSYE